MQTINKEIEALEKACGYFTAAFALELPVNLRPLAFCSPTSFRDPETDNVWHPFLLQKRFSSFLRDQIGIFFRSAGLGFIRLVTCKFGRFEVILAKDSSILAIGPDVICRLVNGEVKTSYLVPEDVQRVNWLIISDGKTDKFLTRVTAIRYLFFLYNYLSSPYLISCSPD